MNSPYPCLWETFAKLVRAQRTVAHYSSIPPANEVSYDPYLQ